MSSSSRGLGFFSSFISSSGSGAIAAMILLSISTVVFLRSQANFLEIVYCVPLLSMYPKLDRERCEE